jgi:hypothetical protein
MVYGGCPFPDDDDDDDDDDDSITFNPIIFKFLGGITPRINDNLLLNKMYSIIKVVLKL